MVGNASEWMERAILSFEFLFMKVGRARESCGKNWRNVAIPGA